MDSINDLLREVLERNYPLVNELSKYKADELKKALEVIYEQIASIVSTKFDVTKHFGVGNQA